jgi:hypothetical protein
MKTKKSKSFIKVLIKEYLEETSKYSHYMTRTR